MSIGRIIIWILVITAGLLLIVHSTRIFIEGFEDDPETKVKQEITQYITLVNDILCPCYTQILTQMVDEELPDSQKLLPVSDQDPDERHKAKATAITKLSQLTISDGSFKIQPIDPTKVESLKFSLETTGLLFPCPPPTDPLQVPNTIDSYIEATIKVFLPKVKEMKDKIESTLSCKHEGFSSSNQIKENFETSLDLSKTSMYNIPYTEVTTPSKELFDDVNNDDSLKKVRIQAFQIKADKLKRVLLSDSFITLSSQYKELMKLKQSAESGKGSSNCSA